MGSMAVKMLMNLIDGKKVAELFSVLSITIFRQSCGCHVPLPSENINGIKAELVQDRMDLFGKKKNEIRDNVWNDLENMKFEKSDILTFIESVLKNIGEELFTAESLHFTAFLNTEIKKLNTKHDLDKLSIIL